MNGKSWVHSRPKPVSTWDSIIFLGGLPCHVFPQRRERLRCRWRATSGQPSRPPHERGSPSPSRPLTPPRMQGCRAASSRARLCSTSGTLLRFSFTSRPLRTFQHSLMVTRLSSNARRVPRDFMRLGISRTSVRGSLTSIVWQLCYNGFRGPSQPRKTTRGRR